VAGDEAIGETARGLGALGRPRVEAVTPLFLQVRKLALTGALDELASRYPRPPRLRVDLGLGNVVATPSQLNCSKGLASGSFA
jgi:hypothetical protein